MQSDSIPAAAGSGFGSFTVVDVETTGLSAADHRVLSVAALTLRSDGAVAEEFHSFIDPGCDPGPVHVHGLTRDLLSGAPQFAMIAPELTRILSGRVLVAHNAGFDYGFLASEFARIGRPLPVDERLCTLALARRVAPPVPDCRLATLAAYYGIPQQRAHDALDDARVLAAVLGSLIADAARLGVAPPLLACPPKATAPDTRRRSWPSRPPKSSCGFGYPGKLAERGALVQGMKVVFTGDTHIDRAELISRSVAAGLDVTVAVSGRTSVLVTNSTDSSTRKCSAAIRFGTPIVSEAAFLRLLEQVEPGTARLTPSVAGNTRAARSGGAGDSGPLAGRRVLVLGGPHQAAAAARIRIAELGGSAAVNLSATVSEVLALTGASNDARLGRAVARGLPVHGPELLDVDRAPSPPVVQTLANADVCTMSRGEVLDLPVEAAGEQWSVRVSWAQDESYEVDVVGFLVDTSERVGAEADFVFYNQPVAPGVQLIADGPSEQSILLDLEQMPQRCTRVVIAAAIDGRGVTFGAVGAIEIEIAAGSEAGVFARAALDAATEECTLLLAEFYLRGDAWRLRAVGQGYPSGLADLARRYGIDVADSEPEPQPR